MEDKIVIVDFAGTLIKAEIIEEANKFRAELLQRGLPSKDEHAIPEELYKINREFVENLTGITKDMIISYRKNDFEEMNLNGKDCQNQISTNLFQIGMYMAAKKYGLNIIPEGLIEQLQRIRDAGYKLAIVSGVRTDIISGMLQIAGMPFEFDYIYGQPPILGTDESADIKELNLCGEIVYLLGDKISDLERVKGTGAKSIFVKWGHPAGSEEEYADYSIEKPEELAEIIR